MTAELRTATDTMASFLERCIQDDGSFVYRISLNPEVALARQYNVLRHAGTMYALADHQAVRPDPRRLELLRRAAGYLRDRCMGPVPGVEGDLWAVWSRPETGEVSHLQAKLGAAGISLVGLLALERVAPGETALEPLRRLARFVTFMQRPDGSFYSKYHPEHGYEQRWVSLYYPGEAALGMTMLYERDPQQAWLETAARALAYLAASREGRQQVEADHWALLATARLMVLYDDLRAPPAPPEAIIAHGAQVCRSIMATAAEHPPGSPLHGCFTADGRTTPTSTRLEGLLAALSFLPAEHEELRREITGFVERGCAFLLRTRVASGLYQGAVPRALVVGPDGGVQAAPPDRNSEVRIDYVQHALSALLEWEQVSADTVAAR